MAVTATRNRREITCMKLCELLLGGQPWKSCIGNQAHGPSAPRVWVPWVTQRTPLFLKLPRPLSLLFPPGRNFWSDVTEFILSRVSSTAVYDIPTLLQVVRSFLIVFVSNCGVHSHAHSPRAPTPHSLLETKSYHHGLHRFVRRIPGKHAVTYW